MHRATRMVRAKSQTKSAQAVVEPEMAMPQVWGPILWDFLFTLTYNIDAQREGCHDELRRMFACLRSVIPCKECRSSFVDFAERIDTVKTEDMQQPTVWLWTIYDMINQKLKKPPVDYDTLVQRHRYITCVANPVSVIDVLCIMAGTSNVSDVIAFADASASACRASKQIDVLIDQLARVASVDANSGERDLTDALYEAHKHVRAPLGIRHSSREEFEALYSLGHVQK